MNRSSRLLMIIACNFLVATSALPQTNWFKYLGNPVLNVGAPGTWDNSGVRIARVIVKDGVYRAWYTGGNPPAVIPRVGYAISPDGINWTKDDSNPVLNPGPAAWDALGSFRPYVVFSDAAYKMWYTGVGAGPVFRIGYASSPDGIAWTKAVANPVLTVGTSGSYDAGGVEHPSVLGPDNQGGYAMWFQGVPGYRTGYATATNETTWTKYGSNPVFPSNAFYPRVIHEGSAFEMWYCIGTSQPASFGYATSPDGISWTTSSENPVLRPGTAGSWDDAGLLPGDVVLDGNIYHLWYAGNDGSVFRSGYAVSPKGMTFEVSSKDGIVDSQADTVDLTIGGWGGAPFEFWAVLRSGGAPSDTVRFSNGYPLAFFACTWTPPAPGTYVVDLLLKMYDSLQFVMKDAATLNILPSSSAEQARRMPSDFQLEQNYPNPFNPTTVVRYSLPERSEVVLTIHNVIGQEVAGLVHQEQPAGTYEVTWDAGRLPSGVYFYRLQAGEFVATKRLMLIR